MQTVKRSWLIVLHICYALLDLTFIIAYFSFQYFDLSSSTIKYWGITPLIIGICGIHLLYTIFIYPWFSKKNLWFSNIVSFALLGMLFSSVIETSGGYNYYYRIGYAAFVFTMSMGGIFAPVTGIVLTWILYLFTLTSVLQPTVKELWLYTLINFIVTIAGLVGWLFFKRFYEKNKDAETVALSKLLEQEQFKTNAMLESISDGVMVINTHGTVQVLNESAAALLGWSKLEALKLDYRSLFVPIEGGEQSMKMQDAAEVITRALTSHKVEQGIVLIQKKNARQVFVDIVASPILETDESKDSEHTAVSKRLVGIIAVLRDVDEQKRQERQRTDFISTASHEMRTPVASIQGFIELALNPKVAQIDDKARNYLLKAQGATKHLGELFQDLLTVSQSDDGRLANNPKVIEITELLSEIVEQGKMNAERKGLKVTFDTDAKLGKSVNPLMYVSADPERLREVVMNLLDNAIKYTSEGIITVGASLKERSVVIRISDTGIGIAAEDIPHLFQKFYRTDNSATREIGGTGLGLYICKQIVDVMGGKIWVESTVGAGSTFFVEIPRVNPESIQSAAGPLPEATT